MTVIFSTCADCIHITGKWPGIISCPAFPDGIPDDYFWNKVDVLKLDECGNGVSFEEKKKADK